MQVHNVAIVFGPTLIWPETVTPNLAANMIYQSRIVEYCLLEYKNIFRWKITKWLQTTPIEWVVHVLFSEEKKLKDNLKNIADLAFFVHSYLLSMVRQEPKREG